MRRMITGLFLMVFFTYSGQAWTQETKQWDPILAALAEATKDLESLAVIGAEGTGTNDDLSGVATQMLAGLGPREGLRIIPPAETLGLAGPEFTISPAGIASVAKKASAQAALFPRVFKTARNYELHLWLLAADEKVLLDETFLLNSLPPPNTDLAPVAAPKPAAGNADPVATGSTPSGARPPAWAAALESYRERALSLTRRQRIVGGGSSIGFVSGNVALGLNAPVRLVHDWMIVEGNAPISEKQLVEMAGAQDIGKRIDDEITSLKTVRNVGIGMTLGGFICAGVASPFFKQGSDEGITVAGTALGLGLATGITGLVLWMTYGPQIVGAQSPYPARHFISQQEAEQLIHSYNEALRQELGVEAPPAPARTPISNLQFNILPYGKNGASLAMGFRF